MREYEDIAKRILIYALLFALFCAVFVLFLKYLFLPLLPFFLAVVISWPILTLADLLNKKTRIPKKFWCIFLILSTVAVLFFLIRFAASRITDEALRLVSGEKNVLSNLELVYNRIVAFLSSHFPRFAERIKELRFEDSVRGLIDSFIGQAPGWAARIASSLPGAAFFAVVTVIASYYFACDNRMIKNKIASLLDKEREKKIRRLFRAVKSSFFCYLRAGGYMLILTFFEVLAGLLILGVNFPLLLSVLVAALDFLPVLGTGVILAPLGCVYLILGDYYKGLGLLILWGITTLVRQIAEPKIVSDNVGIHPLFSLVSAYVGFRLFGAAGLIFLPVCISIAYGVIKELRSQKAG